MSSFNFYDSVINLTEVARGEYISDCEYLISTIEKRSTVAIVDAAASCHRFVEINISDLEEEFHDYIYEQKYDDISSVIDRLFMCSLFEKFTISFEDEHHGVIVISW